MNGATEHTLAELLRVAQEQNANMERLASLMSGQSSGGSGGGGGGLAGMAKNSSLVSAAFSVAGAAVSAVGSVFEVLGNVVGKMVEGVGSAIKGLWSFSQKAMDGTARMSDLFDAFGKLPFFIGELFQIGAGLLRVLEKLTDQYIMLTKVGAGFTGGLTEMRDVAQNLGIGFADLAAMTAKNSQALADAGGTVSNGFRKFVRGMDTLMGEGSQFRNSMFALGVGSKEAGEYMMTVMKLNQTQMRNGQMDAASLGKQTKDYIENLDQLTRLTGLHRDQVNELIKKQADDQIFENFKATLSTEKAKEITNLLAMSTAQMGAEYTENVLKPQLMGIEGPINEASQKIAVATQGASIEMGRKIMDIQNSNMSAQEKMKQTYLVFGQIAVQGKKLTDQMGAQARMDGMPTLNREMLKFALLMTSGGEAAYVAMMKEQDITKKNQGVNVDLMAAQEQMIKIGNEMTLMLADIAQKFGPDLIKIGVWIMTNLFEGLGKFIKWLKSDEVKEAWTMVTWFFSNVVLPKLGKIYDWFAETWSQLKAAWGEDGPDEIMQVLKERLSDGMNNIWEDMQEIWAAVSPGLLKIWDTDIAPVIVKMWNSLLDYLLPAIDNAIKNWLFGSKIENAKEEKKLKSDDRDHTIQSSFGGLVYQQYREIKEATVGAITSLFGGDGDAVKERMFKSRVLEQNEERSRVRTAGTRAGGGLVDPGTYLVGEKGPELLSVGASGNVITNENVQKLLNRLAGDYDNNNRSAALEELNNTMKQLVRHAADTSDYARRTVSAIAQISGDIMPTI